MKRADLPKKGTLDLGLEVNIKPGKGLSGKFMYPPFSILRATNGEWQRRKKQWLSLGIKSEVGRGDNESTAGYKNQQKPTDFQKGTKNYATASNIGDKATWEEGCPARQNTGTSVFDPALCELMYAWFCPNQGQVVDPFAGGSVRGIAAAYMGYSYWGCELRGEQVEANYKQKSEICPNTDIVWQTGDAMELLSEAPQADFIFTCPPYGNLEIYSEEQGDLSNMDYQGFKKGYSQIIKQSISCLKENRFACFVVANFRDKKTGFINDLVGDTVKAFNRVGMGFYNEIILMTAIGSLPVRAGRQFNASRKVGKTHQNILIFYKGDPKQIKEVFREK